MSDANKPYAMTRTQGGRARRWYPDEALERVVLATGSTSAVMGAQWELLDPAEARRQLPQLHQNLRELSEFVNRVQAIADGCDSPACSLCGKRFYPSRSDARYCSGRCRTRAYRDATRRS